ncbi:MAG: lipopolysaccharide transport periplasmic protein LptA [Woeseia sp.]
MKTVRTVTFTAVALLCSAVASAQDPNLRLPINVDADEADYDGKNSMLMYSGLRLSQGNIGVVADEGRATNLDFEDSVWEFSGNVVIDVENGHVECDSARVKFSDHQLQSAVILGSPVTFEMRRRDSDEVTYAEAGRLEYNFEDGIVEFSDEATITEGGNQISSSYLVYNIEEQRINARSAGEGEPRVKITYTPRDSSQETDKDAGNDDSSSQTEDEAPQPDDADNDQ